MFLRAEKKDGFHSEICKIWINKHLVIRGKVNGLGKVQVSGHVKAWFGRNKEGLGGEGLGGPGVQEMLQMVEIQACARMCILRGE